MARITLPDGRWLELRPMWLSERNALLALSDRAGDMLYVDYYNTLAGIVGKGVEALSWEGSVADMAEERLAWLSKEWGRITDEDALPEANGTASETSSPPPASESAASPSS